MRQLICTRRFLTFEPYYGQIFPTPTTQKPVLNGSNDLDLDNYVYTNWSYGFSIVKKP